MGPVRVLVVDDYEPFRRLIRSMVESAGFSVIGEASDGLEAAQKVEQWQPDLVLLDIGLPNLSGIEVAKRVRKLTPRARILFVSQESSPDVVHETMRVGGLGYVEKARVVGDLLLAIHAVLGGTNFVSSGVEGYEFSKDTDGPKSHRHEALFYSEEAAILEGFARFITFALRAGNAAIAVVTNPHSDGLLEKLRAGRVDIDDAVKRGTYISLNAVEMSSTVMVNDLPDPVRFLDGLSGAIESAFKAATAKNPRVAICGERAGLLWAEGKVDAAIRIEQFCNDLMRTYEVDILCSYPFDLHDRGDTEALKCICTEHSAVYSQ